MSAKVVITGGQGFLGSHLVKTAQARKLHALSVVRSESSESSTVSMAALLRDPALLDHTDVLVHSAAVRHRHGTSTSTYRASNVDLVESLLRASANRVGRFVFVSSVGVYGWPKNLPVTEATPKEPATLYSATKVEAERLVERLAPELGLPFTIVRPTIIYGPGDTNGMFEKLANMLRAGRYFVVGSGANILHHTYIDDVVEGIYTLAESDRARNDDFIIAGPETITLQKLSNLMAAALGCGVPRLHVPMFVARGVASAIDIASWRSLAFTDREPPINNEKLDIMALDIAFDPSKARTAGFEPKIRYAEGIRRTFGAAG